MYKRQEYYYGTQADQFSFIRIPRILLLDEAFSALSLSCLLYTSIQREELLPSEKAFAYKMKMDAMKRQAGRPSKNKMCIRDRYGASLSGWTDHLDS